MVEQALMSQVCGLRRYARALTGDQKTGDWLVSQTLAELCQHPEAIAYSERRSVAVFRLFHALFARRFSNIYQPTSAIEDQAQKKLAAIPDDARAAFLLTAMERFSPQDAATVLQIDTAQLAELLTTAGRSIAREIATDVLIIEDERLIALDLQHHVEDLGHTLVGVARTKDEAMAAIKRHDPGLILADIRLANNSSGVEAVNEMIEAIHAPIVFITAYPERLLTGERPEPAFVVSKPYRPDALKAVISQALFFQQCPSEIVTGEGATNGHDGAPQRSDMQ